MWPETLCSTSCLTWIFIKGLISDQRDLPASRVEVGAVPEHQVTAHGD